MKIVSLINENIYKVLKSLYKFVIKPVLNTITLRPLRKYIQKFLREKKIKALCVNIQQTFPDNAVLIFQMQFFDLKGKVCYNGGAERYVKDLSKILYKNNYTPILIQAAKDDMWEKEIDKMRIVGIPLEIYTEAIRFLNKYKFVIYSGLCSWGKFLLHPNIIISHGINWDNKEKDTNIKKIFNIFKDADNIISVDTNTISWLRSTFGASFSNKKMVYIPNYVDTKLYKPIERKNKDLKIIFPRRASKERGYWLMSKVLPDILNKYKNITFDFVGFTHGKKIALDINRLMSLYPNRVNNYMVEPDDMVKVYQNANISVIPTLYAEGTSLSCLEAQACGNAVISTNIGGLPNLIIDGFNGCLINPEAKELENAICNVIENEKFRNYISDNAIIVAQHFDKKIWENRWNDVIINIV